MRPAPITSPVTASSHRAAGSPAPAALLEVLAARHQGVRLDPAAPRPWAAIAAAAHAHDVEPLLYRVAADAGLAVPDPLGAHLRSRYYQTTATNTWLLRELASLAGSLVDHGIPVMLLKGAALLLTVYEDMGLRTLGDVDLLVPPEHAATAMGVIQSHGYALEVGNNELADAGSAGIDPGPIIAFDGQVTLRRQTPPHAVVDLHWTLVDRPPYRHHLPMDLFWRAARPVRLGDAEVVTLSPEATVLHLCAHLALHHPDGRDLGLRWLLDVAEILAHEGGQLDWPTVLRLAQASDLVTSLQWVLPLVPPPGRVPMSVLDDVAALAPSTYEQRAVAAIGAQRRGLLAEIGVVLAYTPGWSMRARYLHAKLLPPPAYMRRRYSIRQPWQLPGYYLYRWLRALRREG